MSEPEPSADNRDALLACARSWEPNARLLGNVRACTIEKVCTDAESAESQLAAVREILLETRAKVTGSLAGAALDDAQWAQADALRLLGDLLLSPPSPDATETT